MTLADALEDQQIRLLLTGPSENLELAFTLVDTRLRKRFAKGVRDRIPGLSSEDLADAWQDTLKALLEAVQRRQFDVQRRLGPWLWTTFIRRACDNLRYRIRTAELPEGMRGAPTETAESPVEFNREEGRRILHRVREYVATLPPKQRTVLRAYMDYFPATQRWGELARRVSEATGQMESPDAVRRALWEGRKKIVRVLRYRSA